LKQSRICALAFLSLALTSTAQEITIQKPPVSTRAVVTNEDPGDFAEVDLFTIANDIGTLENKNVRTRGTLERVDVPADAIQEYYVLRAGAARVLLLPGYGMLRDDLERLLRSEVWAKGIVRALRPNMRDGLSLDATRPELPPVPFASPELPRISLTALSLSNSASSAELPNGRTRARQILETPKLFKGKVVRIVGQFRGRNLYGDLPAGTERTPFDWVLLDAGQPIWVTNRAPKGDGFALDPSSGGDTRHWVEVEGKPDVWNGLVYFRASRVMLAFRDRDRR
jgi:hypothetical protein